MSSSIHSRLKTLLAAAMVAAGMAMPAWADIVYGCFTVVPYSVNWHVKCTLDGFTDAVDFAIDDNKNNGYRVRACLAFSGEATGEVTGEVSEEIEITVTPVEGKTNEWTFAMPAADVEVEVEYVVPTDLSTVTEAYTA